MLEIKAGGISPFPLMQGKEGSVQGKGETGKMGS